MGWSYGASLCVGQLLYVIGPLVLSFRQLARQKSNSEYFGLTTEQRTRRQILHQHTLPPQLLFHTLHLFKCGLNRECIVKEITFAGAGNVPRIFGFLFNGLFLLFQDIKWMILHIISSSTTWIELVQLAELCVG